MPETLTAPVTSPIDLSASPFAGLDSKVNAPPPVKAAPVEPVKEAGAGEALKTNAETKVVEPVKPVEKTTDKVTPSKEDRTAKDPKWFREQHEKAQAEIKGYHERVKSMEAKIADYEAKGKDTATLSERLAQMEQELDRKNGELRAAKQETSPEFQKTYDKPFNQAADYAKSIVEQMAVADDQGAQRAATWNDFAALYQLPINKAAAMARQMFGDDASIVIGQLTELHRLDHVRNNALAEEKAKWKENETKEQAQAVQREQGWRAAVTSAQKHLTEANPHFRDAEGDDGKATRELREEGYAIFDSKPTTFNQSVLKAAEIRHRVAAHGPLVHQLSAKTSLIGELEGKLKEAEATIAELRGNGPAKGTRSATQAGGEKHWSDELRTTVSPGASG